MTRSRLFWSVHIPTGKRTLGVEVDVSGAVTEHWLALRGLPACLSQRRRAQVYSILAAERIGLRSLADRLFGPIVD